MMYRALGKTGIEVSEVALGCEHLEGKDYETVKAILDRALSGGINLLDVFMSEPNVRTNIGRALAGRREAAVIQGHIGASWQDGQYCRTRDIALCKAAFADLLERLQTDYIDVGMLHFIDTQEDYAAAKESGVIAWAQELKARGVIKVVGMSSHNPQIAQQAVDDGIIEVLMFSLNPAYDMLPEEATLDELFEEKSYQNAALAGINEVRARLYATCEAAGVGITVMKGLGAGALLKSETSPFGALSVTQCVHYALSRPAVASILVGCKTPDEVDTALRYEGASLEERDYSVVLSEAPRYSMKGRCMYCNHCLPCPSRIDIAAVNKYLDLAQLSQSPPPTVGEHYKALHAHAGDCIACGSCEERCPFGVPVIERMQAAKERFGA